MRLLVAEDDSPLRSVLERGLRENGYVVDAVADGEQAEAYLRAYGYEVAILDWRMPKLSGIEVLQRARQRGDRTPVLMLTARDATEDRVIGLNTGADDYLVKPFAFAELLARLQALQRRPAFTLAPKLACGHLSMDTATRAVTSAGETLLLTATELGVLEVLLRRSPAVVTRSTIAVQVWDDEADAVGSNTIDVHVGRLRAKLSGSGARIETVRGMGYRLVPT
ncbi:MAG TPA: response regulator transcription factor [Acidimicrobiales bacterium]|nr:response regulator transcription factor [Acidimicrobiales bacterium]